MRPALPREISGLTSHDRINTMGGLYTPVHALMNNKWRCTVFNKGNLSEASVNFVVSKSTENIGCSFVNSETKSNNIHGVFLHTSSCYFSILKGGMVPDNVSDCSPWYCPTERLAHISLMPYDVGGSGDCFFKSVSHQLYGTPDLHFQIRMAGIRHLNDHPQLYIESISNNCWENYIQQMSTLGTWCDNIIIQAVANAHNCVIHITESDINKPDGTILIITPVVHEGQTNTIFIGYINELHYVSTVPDKRNQQKQIKIPEDKVKRNK